MLHLRYTTDGQINSIHKGYEYHSVAYTVHLNCIKMENKEGKRAIAGSTPQV